MKYFIKTIAIILAMVSVSSYAGNTGKILNVAELQKLLIGHTYPLGKSGKDGMYFSSADKAIIYWKGKTENVDWYAANGSRFCYKAVLFGGKEECIKLTKTTGGNYIHDYYGKLRKVSTAKIKKGKIF